MDVLCFMENTRKTCKSNLLYCSYIKMATYREREEREEEEEEEENDAEMNVDD